MVLCALISEQLGGDSLVSSSSKIGAMQNQNIVGVKVRNVRHKSGMTQDVLATKCNLLGWDVSRGTISKIEAGLRRVNDAEVALLAQVLKIQISDLYPQGTAVLLSVVRQGGSEA